MKYDPGVEEKELSSELVTRLKMAEVFSRRLFEITSGYREDDERCHGSRQAVDIRCNESADRFHIVRGLLNAGFVRIGVYTAHIHADVCREVGFAERVLWLGGASS